MYITGYALSCKQFIKNSIIFSFFIQARNNTVNEKYLGYISIFNQLPYSKINVNCVFIRFVRIMTITYPYSDTIYRIAPHANHFRSYE